MTTSSPRVDRKAAILDAAVARIVAHGIEGLRVRDVAADVGIINNATLHHHFPTKAVLVVALVQRFVAGFAVAGGVPEEGDLEARLAGYVATRVALMRSQPETFVVLAELMVHARRDGELRAPIAGLQDRWRDYLAAACRAAGAAAATALVQAERCRRELLGTTLDLVAGRLP